ncbi:hypothetical protein UK23_38670 [Lentzea aerocolonigenes]|uniref:HTH cro/C1-type domain-containing protein n=1 Tax=Lentzea aerocolonigenes TaxID=68170 RepID=A0A0F0GL29_LENAE|nr:hypothetical protein UK23_38670 [Lentzea aerocolonigenes]
MDSDDDELLRFAADLRLLREKAGKPTYRELSKVAHYSVTVLSEAASGRKLPSLAVTVAYAHACGGDVEQWRRRWHEVAEGTKPADPEREPPYLGLGAFQAEDSSRFFGREKLVGQLLEKVSERPFVGVFGASGSGKSSLLRAGLVASRPADVFSPGPHPLQLWGECTAELVVIDQFEEVFTLCRDEDEREAFIEAITHSANSHFAARKVVIGVRSDFYGHCGRYPDLVDALHDAQVLVGTMSPAELRRAITEPALRAGYTVEGALVSVLEAERAPLPLVSHALLETWRRRRGTRLTVAGYEETGGVRHALAQSAEVAYLELDEAQQAIARKIFLRLTALGEGTEDTKRRVSRDSLDNDDDTLFVLDHLARARLITLDDTGVDLTHEAVIRSWPRLSGWLTANRDGLRVHHQLTEAASAWESLNRDSGALYRGVRLALAREWATGDDDAMSARERRFLYASIEAEEAEQEATRRQTRRLRQLVGLLTVLLVLAVTAVGYAIKAQRETTEQRNIAIARKAVSDAQGLQPADAALSTQLSLAAQQLSDNTETRDNLLSATADPYFTRIAAHGSDVPAVATRGTTLATVSWDKELKLWDISDVRSPRLLSTTDTSEELHGAEFVRDGVLALTSEQNVLFYDVTDPSSPKKKGTIPRPNGTAKIYDVTFTPDGTTAAVAVENVVQFWQVTDPDRPVLTSTLTGFESLTRRVRFRPDGKALAVAVDKVVTLWTYGDGEPRQQGVAQGHSAGIESLAFTPDGRSMATGGWDHLAVLWDVTDLANPGQRAKFADFTAIVWGVSFSPDGTTLAATGDRRTRLWDLAHLDPEGRPRLLATLTTGVYEAEFTQDNSTLVISEGSKSVRLQKLSDLPLLGHENNISATSFRPDGQVLATSSWDSTVWLWRMTPERGREPITRITDARGYLRFTTFSPDGKLLAVASDDGFCRLYDVSDVTAPVLLRALPAQTDRAVSAAFTPDSKTLAVGTFGQVLLWDITNAKAPQLLSYRDVANNYLWAVHFSPDGRKLIAGTGDRSKLFDVTDLRSPSEIPFSGHSDTTLRGGFSPDGRLLATAFGDKEIRFTDPRTMREVGRLSGLTAGPYAVTFHGTLMATSHTDGVLRLWDVADPAHPRLVTKFTGHARDVAAIEFSPDGTYLASGGNDTTVRLWDVDVDRAVERLCARHPEPLTREQWAEYFPDVSYRRVCR